MTIGEKIDERGHIGSIANKCPSCGHKTLFIASGGWITCGNIDDCEQPDIDAAIQQLLVENRIQELEVNIRVSKLIQRSSDGSLEECIENMELRRRAFIDDQLTEGNNQE